MSEPAGTAQVLRVLTWNVHDLKDDVSAVEHVLHEVRPDVACLQEAPRWPFSRHRIAALAARSRLFFTAGGRVSAGVAILTSLRVDVRAAEAGPLPVARWRPAPSRPLPTRPRGYAMATVRLPGTAPVTVASVHLGLDQVERDTHVGLLRQRFAEPQPGWSASPPLVVAGDLNEPPEGPSWTALGSSGADACAESAEPTFPSGRPRRRIDAVLVDSRLHVLSAGIAVIRDPDLLLTASDHLPLLAEIELPAEGRSTPCLAI